MTLTEAKHTPSRCRVYQGWLHPSFDGPSPQTTNGDTAICEPLGPDKAANARRLAACWNACHDAGLSTEAMEYGVVGDLLAACEAALTVLEPTIQERGDEEWTAVLLLRAAIAKAR